MVTWRNMVLCSTRNNTFVADIFQIDMFINFKIRMNCDHTAKSIGIPALRIHRTYKSFPSLHYKLTI